jgi:WD40-like Beta Propeller Repeat
VRGQIGAFAQDGARIAWLSSSPRCRDLVQMRNLATGKQWALATKRGATCRNWARMEVSPLLALAGTHALWGLYQTTLSHQLLTLIAGGPGKRDRVVTAIQTDCDSCRVAPTMAHAGDGRTLVYRWSGINRVVGNRSVRVPHAGGIAFLSAAGTDVAFARYLGTDYNADASWSPTGKQLAFTSGRDYGNPSLYVARPTGRGMTNLTGASYVVTPAWSPTGAAIAYVAAGPANWALWTINPLNKARRKLASNVAAGFPPAWSPNGFALGFTRQEGSGYGIYSVVVGSGIERRIATGSEPSWSPDGSRLVFTGPAGITVAYADGTGKTVLAAGRSPSFSPDGTRIVFERSGDIWLMNADGNGRRQLTNGGHDLLPRWAPGGTRIAFERGDPRRPYVISTDGSGLWKASSRVAEGDLGWSPDAARVVFAGAGGVYVAQADGSGVRRIAIGARSRIEIRHARTGLLQKAIVATGHAETIALSRSVVAVLAGGRLSIYGRASGRRLSTVRVPRGVAPELSAAGRTVVFRAAKTIWLVSGRRLRRLAVAQAVPIGLSIEGRRVAWAENAGGRGRIRAVTLP